MKNLFLLILLLSFNVMGQYQPMYINSWRVYPENEILNFKDTFQIKSPCNVHSLVFDYLNLNPFESKTEHGLVNQLIENNNWVFESSFDFDSALFRNKSSYKIVFEGIDTYAKIYLNDSLIQETDNMFHIYKIQVDRLLKSHNKLKLIFESPFNKKQEIQSYKLPSGNETGENQKSCYMRKAAFQFGWDWAPRYVTLGIWKPCYLEVEEPLSIENFYLTTNSIQAHMASVKVDFDIYSNQSTQVTMEFMDFQMMLDLKVGLNHVTFFHHITNPKLWQPNGHGEAFIYHENLNILDEKLNRIYNKKVKFGIRKVELINDKDSIGTSFYFKVNDKPLFCKGANYVPSSNFLTNVTDERIDSIIQLVKNANMNMIRVWGGGIYESDYFYNRCDENGIMVWQDFMFANSLYPNNENFHLSVQKEIEGQVLRLRNHPAIVLWCGNNEIEVAWQNWGWQKQYNYSLQDSIEIWQHYEFLFKKLIPTTVKKFDQSRGYISSTPQSNWGKPENFNHGAMHYWGVWHGDDNINDFRNNVGRFMVEYGFQSYPDTTTLFNYFGDSIFDFENSNFKNLQKSYVGLKQINKEIANNFGNYKDVKDWIVLSQKTQALALKNAIIAHRLKMPHCMGTLFWQLNDCWPGASWSVIDYDLNPKQAYYEVQKWFAPVIAVTEFDKKNLYIKLNSDTYFKGNLELLVSTELEEVYQLDSILKFEIEAFQTKLIPPIQVKKLKKKYHAEQLKLLLQISDQNNKVIFINEIQL